MTIRVSGSIFAALAFLACPRPAFSQTYTWDGGAGTGDWSNAVNWSSNTLPIAGSSTIINLSGTVQTATVQNLGSPFLLSQLVMTSNANTGFTVTGNQLQFAPGGKIAFNGPATNFGLRVDNAIDFGSGAISIDTNTDAGIGTFEIILGGILTGSGTLTKTGSGELILAGTNSNYTGAVSISGGGQIQLAGANALGRNAAVTVGSGSVLLAGNTQSASQGFAAATGVSQSLGSVEGTGTFQIGNVSSAATTLVGFNGGSRVFSGTVSAGNSGSRLTKVGTGSWEFTATSGAFLAGLSVRDGTLLLDGNGALAPNTSNISAVGGTILSTGGLLRLDNAATNNENRLQNNGIIGLAGGTLQLDGNAAANTSETIGGFDVGTGMTRIVVNPAAVGFGTQLNVAPTRSGVVPFTRSSTTGTVFFRGENLGAFSSSSPPGTSAVAGIVFLDPTTINAFEVGGNGTGATTSLLPFALGSTTNGSEPDTFATYGTNGIRPLIATEYAAFATAGNTNNVSAGTFTVSPAATRNALVATGGTISTTAALTLTAGAMLTTGATTVTGAGAVIFGASGASTAYITTATGANLTFLAPITATNIAKSGGGTLTVSRTATLGASATVAVNAGTLAFSSTGAVTNTGGIVTYQVSKGATLDVSGLTSGLSLGTNKTLTGNGSVVGNVIVASGGTVTPDSLTGPGTLNVAGMGWQGGGSYRWTATSVVTDAGGVSPYTASRIAGTGTLDLTTSLTSSNRFTIKVTSLAPDHSAGAVYDFDPNAAYTWTIASFAGINNGTGGFDATKFTVDSSAFTGATQAFTLTQSGNDLVLVYGNPVPEPLGLLAFAGLAYSFRRLRRTH